MSDRSSSTNSPLSPCGRARSDLAGSVRGQRRSRVVKRLPLTLPAMRLARLLDALPLRYLSAGRKTAAGKPSPTRGEGIRGDGRNSQVLSAQVLSLGG